MKVCNMFDFFGPRINCRAKLHYIGQTEPIFESEGFDLPEEDEILNSYIIDIGIDKDENGIFLDLTLEA